MSDGSEPRPAATPEPPYFAVVFTSRLRTGRAPEGESSDATGRPVGDYGETAERMIALAAEQAGFLGVESARGAAGLGITVSYWRDRASIQAWRRQAEHAEVQRHGRSTWYETYTLRVAEVRAERTFEHAPDGTSGGA